MGVLEILLTVGGIVATMIWEYYREKQASKGEADVEVQLNTPEGDIVTINDIFKVTLEAGSISDKVINVEVGKLDIPGRETIELKEAKIDLKKMKIKSPNLEKSLNLKKIEKAVNKEEHTREEANEVDLGDIAEDIVDIVEDAVETAADPNAKHIASTTSSVLKLLAHMGSWIIGARANKSEESITEHTPLMVMNGISEPEGVDVLKEDDDNHTDINSWIDEVNELISSKESIPTNPVTEAKSISIEVVDSTINLTGETSVTGDAAAAA